MNLLEKTKLTFLVLILIGVLSNIYLLWAHETYSTDCTGVWSEIYDVKSLLERLERRINWNIPA